MNFITPFFKNSLYIKKDISYIVCVNLFFSRKMEKNARLTSTSKSSKKTLNADKPPPRSVVTEGGRLIGNRIPKDFFISKGKGESEITIHAGSYHLALRDAGIEMCNIITYSSILSGIANEIKKPKTLVHGSVMETIMAVSTAEKGNRATAAIVFGWLYDRKTGEKHGGLVCEYNGCLPEKEAVKQLRASLNELYTNGYDGKFEMKDITLNSESMLVKKNYGTVLVSLCWVNYVVPIY